MGKDFETHLDAEVAATPEQVWDAVATGPGISSWFVGHTEVDGETVRTSFGDNWMPAATVTAAEAAHRFAYRIATPVTTFGPPVTDWPRAWQELYTRLGLDRDPRPGDVIPGGVVSFTNPHTLLIRTPNALHRYLRGFHGSMVESHSQF